MTEFEEFYNERVAQYTAQVDEYRATPHIVMIGDSITEAFPHNEFPYSGLRVFNQGISGDMISRPDGGIMRRLHLATASQPQWVFVMIGINDMIYGDRDLERMEREYPQIVRDLAAAATPKTRICVQTVMPTSGEFEFAMWHVQRLNRLIQEEYAAWGSAQLLDMHWAMHSATTGLLHDYFTDDGLHLNDYGNERWSQIVEGFIGAREREAGKKK